MALLTLESVGFESGSQRIVSDVDLVIETGEFVTITGPSGSGKSTLLKLLASLLTPTGGMIYYQGKDIETLSPMLYRREVSYCFQQPDLFGQTVRDNLRFPFEIRQADFSEEQAIRKLQEVDLPAAYLDKPVTQLSGGEKQRVALIRHLLFPPAVLLLDEVTAGLDAESKQVVLTLIRRVRGGGTTIVAVTHDAQELTEAARLITMEEGRVIHDESAGS